jgi:hypothetical protein
VVVQLMVVRIDTLVKRLQVVVQLAQFPRVSAELAGLLVDAVA